MIEYKKLTKIGPLYRFKNEPYTGEVVNIDDEGTICSHFNITGGLVQGLYTRYCKRGIPSHVHRYYRSMLHGVSIFYNCDSGEVDDIISYRYGKKQGLTVIFKNRKILGIVEYVNDELVQTLRFSDFDQLPTVYDCLHGEWNTDHMLPQIKTVEEIKNQLT